MPKGKNSTDFWSIENRYQNAFGKWCNTSPKTRNAILKAMRSDKIVVAEKSETKKIKTETKPPNYPTKILSPNEILKLPPSQLPATLILEDKTTINFTAKTRLKLPLGYHELHFRAKQQPTMQIIVSPPRCYLPDMQQTIKMWGFALQLYALRSEKSWGIGDLADLKEFSHFAKKQLHSGIILLNPLTATLPITPQQPSPYFPSSRLYKNLLYLNIENVAKNYSNLITTHLHKEIEKLAKMGQELNRNRHINRDEIFRLKLTALKKIWLSVKHHGIEQTKLQQYAAKQEKSFINFTIFCALSEHYQCGWRKWPKKYHDPHSLAVNDFAAKHKSEVAFYQWLQWLLDTQLQQAATILPLINDVPIGGNPDGADAWLWQDALAMDISIGAPPDAFSPAGQNWGLPPFIPHKLRQLSFEPFKQMIQANLRHAKGLRLDHIMGLFHLFWIPSGMNAKDGAYVKYPADEFLAILALESHRAKAIIIGEDLGTVAKGIRKKMAEKNILSSRVMWFAKENPERYPYLSIADVATHDMPTIAGLASGEDLKQQRESGIAVNKKEMQKLSRKLYRLAGIKENPYTKIENLINNLYQRLIKSPSMIVTISLANLLGVKERINMPNTNNKHPNWSLAYPYPLSKIKGNTILNKVAKIFNKHRKKALDFFA